MLLVSPHSFIYALLLCIPLVIIFTIITPTTNDLSPPAPPPLLSKADESLLRVAARVDQLPTQPKKLAFMFLTTTPLPFAPLWELYFSQAPKTLFNVYVHADPTRRYHPPFSGVFANRSVRAEPSRRNTPGLAAAVRRLLAHALLDDPANAMFALLSPSCAPLRPFGSAYAALLGAAPPERSFVEILAREAGSRGRWAARGDGAMLPEVRLEEFRIGSQFWVLSRRHARLVAGDRRLWAKFGLPCVRLSACYPEENYFPTLLAMYDPSGCIPATLTHVNWKGRSSGHPRTYGGGEVRAELIYELRNAKPRYGDDYSLSSSSSDHFHSNWSHIRQTMHYSFLFARKFAPNAIGPLMSLAHSVILRDS